jgi:hypothetical protein
MTRWRAAARLWQVASIASAVAFGCAKNQSQRFEPDRAIPGVTVDAPCVDGRCVEGLYCGYGVDRKGRDRCVLEPGRCRDEWDCGRSVQRCRRFGTRLGVCQDSGL